MSKIIDVRGNALRKKEMVKAIFFKSNNGIDWELIKAADVPGPIKNSPDIMDCLIGGEIIESVGTHFYRVERVN